jgi:hypothetical protein
MKSSVLGSNGKAALLMLAVVVTLRIASSPTANLSYLIIALYALAGRTQVIHALALLFLFSMLNPAIAPDATMATVGRYAVIVAGALSVLIRTGAMGKAAVRGSYPTLATLVLGALLVVHSVLISRNVDVSVLKVITWTVVAATLLAAWGGLCDEARNRTAEHVFAGLVAIMVLSLPLLAIPAISYLRNGTGFQGILNHPQVFGATIALLGAWAGARLLAESRQQWRWVLLTGVCLVLVVLTEARTGGLGMVLGLVSATILVPMLSRRPVRMIFPGIVTRRVHLVAGAALLGALLSGTTLTNRLGEFLTKGGEDVTNFGQAYELSRGVLIAEMMKNIAIHPLVGIGFGISSQPDFMVVDRDPVFGLPTSASIEKGVFPIAVVEEVGIFGALAVSAWIWMVVRRASRAGITALTLVFTTLLLNLGEHTFFSTGGLGLLPLILLTWAATAKPMRARG